MARALFAAGVRAGDIVHNSFSYHLTPGAWMLEAGAHALGCAVIPGGVGNTESQIEAIAHLKPSAYMGTPDFLKVLLDTAEKSGKDISSLKRGLVSGAALPPSLREELGKRGGAVLQCYAVAETGVIAYESEAREGMIVNEDIIVEIVRPGTGDPVPEGDVGEVVVTTFNHALSDDPARDRRHVGDHAGHVAVRAHQHAHPGLDGPRRPDGEGQGHVRAAGADCGNREASIPELGRVRLVVTRDGEQDAMTLKAECARARARAERRGRRDAAGRHQDQGQRDVGRTGLAAERRQGDRG